MAVAEAEVPIAVVVVAAAVAEDTDLPRTEPALVETEAGDIGLPRTAIGSGVGVVAAEVDHQDIAPDMVDFGVEDTARLSTGLDCSLVGLAGPDSPGPGRAVVVVVDAADARLADW